MKIGFLGGGNVGSSLAELARNAGHDVVVGGRSGPTSFADAAAHGDIVILTVHYHVAAEVIPPLGTVLNGKILVDATNPLNEDWSPLLLGQETSAAEEIAKIAGGAHVVKAFNTIFADVMNTEKQDRAGQKIAGFVAGDTAEVVEQVSKLLDSMGFAAVPIQKLAAARYLEGMAHLNIELAIGQGGGTNAAFLYHREQSL